MLETVATLANVLATPSPATRSNGNKLARLEKSPAYRIWAILLLAFSTALALRAAPLYAVLADKQCH